MKLYTSNSCGPCRVLKQTMEREGLGSDVERITDIPSFPPEVRQMPTLEHNGSFYTGYQDVVEFLKDYEGT